MAEYCAGEGLLPAGRPILALVSGGPDSMCLLHLLVRVHSGPVGVLTVDHGLRAASAAEADAVCAAARGLGLAVHRVRLELEGGAGVQERARNARLEAAHDTARRHGYARIATGHTADDQAETVLMRIARGAGRTGALAMAPRRGRIIRPLLCLRATDTREWCVANGVATADDPSNGHEQYRRVRVRGELLPALERIHPGAAGNVVAFAGLLRDEAEVLERAVDEAWARVADGAPGLRVDALQLEPPALQRLLVRRLIGGVGLPAGALERRHLERALAVTGDGGRISLPGAGGVARERGRLVAFGPDRPAPAPVSLSVPGRACFGEVAVCASVGAAGPARPGSVALRVDGPFQVRGPRPGDRIAVAGVGHRAVGRLLADAGVAARLRPRVPVVAQGDHVLWVVGHRAGDDVLAARGDEAVLLHMERAA